MLDQSLVDLNPGFSSRLLAIMLPAPLRAAPVLFAWLRNRKREKDRSMQLKSQQKTPPSGTTGARYSVRGDRA